jgi:hypothetical protein
VSLASPATFGRLSCSVGIIRTFGIIRIISRRLVQAAQSIERL